MTSLQVEARRAWVAESYDIHEPLTVEPIAAGTNNHSFSVITDRTTYIVKQYRNAGIEQRLAFEHALLTALARARHIAQWDKRVAAGDWLESSG